MAQERNTAALEWGAPLVDAVSRVQGLVSEEAPAEATYDAVVKGAMLLVGGDSGALRFVDPEDRGWMQVVSYYPKQVVRESWRQRAPISEGVSGKTITTGQIALMSADDPEETKSRLAPDGIQAAIGVPVRERGDVVGALVVGAASRDRRWSRRDRELLLTYAGHIEVALAVARAGHDARRAFTDALTGLDRHRRRL